MVSCLRDLFGMECINHLAKKYTLKCGVLLMLHEQKICKYNVNKLLYCLVKEMHCYRPKGKASTFASNRMHNLTEYCHLFIV